MNFKVRKIAIFLVFLLAGSINMHGASAKPKVKYKEPVVMSIIHAIPPAFGADKVDIYSNGTLVFNDATPGTMKTFSLESGSQQISIYPDGVLPTSDTASVLSFRPVYLNKGMNVTFVAHLNSLDKPTLSLFKNMNTEPGNKRAWLTVRHVAAAGAVDVRTDSIALFRTLTSGYERKISLRFGSYPVKVVLAGTSTNALPPTTAQIKDNKNLVVYVWGSAAKNNLQYLIQEVATK